MHETNIKKLDLNLLIALKALLEEKNVTKAAACVCLSQPAMSRTLSRLREMFQDPLLVKGSKGMILTTRAKDLYNPLLNILNDIQAIVTTPVTDPALIQGEINIATRDYGSAIILPKVIKCIREEAPNLSFNVIPLINDEVQLLENHKVDFVLTATEINSAILHRAVLFKDNFICLIAKNHPAFRDGMNIKTYLDSKHCLISTDGFGLGVVDTILEKNNIKRKIVVRIPHFLAAADMIAESDLVVTLPRRLGELLSKQSDVALIEPPIEIPSVPIYLYWHTRHQRNPIHSWVRKIFLR